MKKIMCLLLAVSMLLMLLSGCGNSSASAASAAAEPEASASSAEAPAEQAAPSEAEEANEANEAASAAEASVEEPEEAAPVYETVEVEVPFADGEEISMFLLLPPFITAMVDNVTDLTVLGELEARTGLSFDITAGNYLDAETDVNLLIASGDYPDIINGLKNYSAGYEAAMDEDVVIDLREYIENDVPNLMAALYANGDDGIKQLMTASGRIATFPQVHQDPYIDNFVIGVNQDVMDELSLDTPSTLDEFHDILTAVHDATGLQYGLSNEGADGVILCGMNLPAFGSTGTGVESFRVVDGTVEFGSTTEEMRSYLEMIAAWFQEGLIYTDFLSYEVFQQTNMVSAGTLFGIGNVNAQTIGEAAANGINVTGLPFLTVNEGDTVKMKGSGEIIRTQSWAVSTAASEESIDLICQLVNYIFSDEGTLLFNYGIEGEGYELDADGNPEWTDLVMNYEGGYTTAAMLYATATPAEYICGVYDDSKFNFSYTDAQIACQEIIDNGSTGEYDFPIGAENMMTTEETAEASNISGDLGTYISETFLSWICGESVLDDAAWSTYIANCENMGVADLTAIYQTTYERYMAQ